MSWGGTEKIASVGPLKEVKNTQKNGKTVTTASRQNKMYQNIFSRCWRRRRFDRSAEYCAVWAEVHHSASVPRSSMRIFTIEKTSVMTSSTMAIAEASPAWFRRKACRHR